MLITCASLFCVLLTPIKQATPLTIIVLLLLLLGRTLNYRLPISYRTQSTQTRP